MKDGGSPAWIPTGRGKNLAAEAPNWEFDKTRASACRDLAETNCSLQRFRCASPNETHKRIFYTALYHLSLGPNSSTMSMDATAALDNQIHSLATSELT